MTVGVESYGYPGSFTAAPWLWSLMQKSVSNSYFVNSAGEANVTPKSDGTRQVNISVGIFGGRGILDRITSVQTVTLPIVASGTRWFMIVARRDFNSGVFETSFSAIDAGTSNTTIPAREILTQSNPKDDQPLALVPLTAGDTVPGTPIRLGVFGGNSSFNAFSELVLQYMDEHGMEIRIGSTLWRRVINPAGNSRVWETTGPGSSVALTSVTGGFGSAQSGWGSVTPNPHRLFRNGNELDISFATRRTGTALTFSADGSIGNVLVFSFNEAWWPNSEIVIPCRYWSGTDETRDHAGLCVLTAVGNLFLVSGAGDSQVTQQTNGALRSLSLHAHFTISRES